MKYILIAFFTLISACMNTKNNDNPIADLTGIWTAKSIQGEVIKIDAHPSIEFNIDEMKISGNDGCNQIFGEIKTLEEGTITFGMVGGTKKYCPNINNLDSDFRQALSETATYTVNNSILVFLKEDGVEVLKFSK